MQDFFPTMAMKANPQCNDRHCREQQEEYKVGRGVITLVMCCQVCWCGSQPCAFLQSFLSRRGKQSVQKLRLCRKKRKWCMRKMSGVSHQ